MKGSFHSAWAFILLIILSTFLEAEDWRSSVKGGGPLPQVLMECGMRSMTGLGDVFEMFGHLQPLLGIWMRMAKNLI